MGKNTVVIIHIYGARAIYLLLYDHHENESDLSETEICITQPIFTQMLE